MLLNNTKNIVGAILILFSCCVQAYDQSGVNTTFNFGTIVSPFSTLTLTDNTICIGYTIIVESSTYFVRATSSGSSTTAFQMTNSTNSAYKLTYQVAWAGTTTSQSYVNLSSGVSSSSSFTAQPLNGMLCSALPFNASMQLQLLNANQVLAKQGSYSDTLTILISAT